MIVTSKRSMLTAAAALSLLAGVTGAQAEDPSAAKLENRIEAIESWINANDPAKAKPGEAPKNTITRTGVGNLTLDSLLQVWMVNDPTTVFGANENAETTMRLRRAEIKLGGDIIPEIGFQVMIDPAKQLKLKTEESEEGEITNVAVDQSTNILQDLHVDLRIAKMFPSLASIFPNMELWVGQQKTPVTEEGYRSSSKLDLVERSLLGRTYGDFRDQGLLLKDSYKYLDYYLGLFNGSGRNKSDDNNEKNGTARLVFKPLQEWRVGVSGLKGSKGEDEADVERLGGDSQIEVGPVSLKGEYMYGKDGDTDGQGFYVQPGVFVIPEKLQLVARFDQFDPDSDKDDDTIQEISGAVNWFFAKYAARTQVEYRRRNNEATEDEDIILINLQAAF